MNKFISFLLLMVSAVVLTACAHLSANTTTDMDRLGARIERAIEAVRRSTPPVVTPNEYERTDTVCTVEGEQLPDGSTSTTTTKRLVVKGDLRFGVNDPLLRDTTGIEPLLRIRGSNGDRPPFYVVPTQPTPSAEAIRRAMPTPGYQPPKDGCRK